MLAFSAFLCYTNFAVGGIAQLGERLNGIQEVSGSIPLISTKHLEIQVISRCFAMFRAFPCALDF